MGADANKRARRQTHVRIGVRWFFVLADRPRHHDGSVLFGDEGAQFVADWILASLNDMPAEGVPAGRKRVGGG